MRQLFIFIFLSVCFFASGQVRTFVTDGERVTTSSLSSIGVYQAGVVYQEDIALKTIGRSGLTMLNTISNDSIQILTPVFLSTNYNDNYVTSKTRDFENVFDGYDYTIYFQAIQIIDVAASGTSGHLIWLGADLSTTEKGFAINISSNRLRFIAGDADSHSGSVYFINNCNTVTRNAGWLDFYIQVDSENKRLRCTVYNSAGTSLNTSAVNIDISTWTFNSTASTMPITFKGWQFAVANFKKFKGLKTLAQCKNDTYTTNLELWYPTIYDGTDVSGNNHHLAVGGGTGNKYYCNKSDYVLKHGFSTHQRLNSINIDIPNKYDNTYIDRSHVIMNSVSGGEIYGSDTYFQTIEQPGDSVYHNLADSKLRFPIGSNWDRSNTIIFNDSCRASAYYDTANTRDWHISELNKIILNSYTNPSYHGLHFVKVTNNSFDDRHLLKEILSYKNNKTGVDYLNTLAYCGDQEAPNIFYLKYPYTDVIKITALSDAQFRFNVNNSIIYKQQDIYDKIDNLLAENPTSDSVWTIFRWLRTNFDIWISISNKYTYNANLINAYNSYSRAECGGIAQSAWEILDHYFPGKSHVAHLTGHIVNYLDSAYIDVGYHRLYFDGLYKYSTIDEIVEDKLIMLEPLRSDIETQDMTVYWNRIVPYYHSTGFEVASTVDDLSMKLPANSTLTFPVKSTNVPILWDETEMNEYANGIVVSDIDIIGNVSMPWALLQITGTGTVKINDTVYTLPTDEAVLKAKFQSYVHYYNEYEIITNTGGITSEFLIEQRHAFLWKYNRINYGLISGNIKCESVSTTTPIRYGNFLINKDSADSWSLDFNEYKGMSGMFRLPTSAGSVAKYYIDFKKTGIKKPIDIGIPSHYFNAPYVTNVYAKAGTPVIDQCLASKLMPRDTSFTTTLELSFISYDGSDCYYTTNGDTPTSGSTKYTDPLTISATTTLKWINIKAGYANSNINTRVITKL